MTEDRNPLVYTLKRCTRVAQNKVFFLEKLTSLHELLFLYCHKSINNSSGEVNFSPKTLF